MKLYSLKLGKIIIGYLIAAGLVPGILKAANIISDEIIFIISGFSVLIWSIWIIAVFAKSFRLKPEQDRYAKFQDKRF